MEEKFFNPDKVLIETIRHLPHWEQDGVMQFVTFHLADSFPQSKLREIDVEKEIFIRNNPLPLDKGVENKFSRVVSRRKQEIADNGYGACWFKNKECSELLNNIILKKDGSAYDLEAYVIMPNHVHMLLSLFPGVKLSKVMKDIKGASAREINLLVKRQGRLWDEESFDTMIRSYEHYDYVIHYILKNLRHGGYIAGGKAFNMTYNYFNR